MQMNDYQTETRKTAIYPAETAIVYTVLGLTNEAGEVAGKIKKVIRDNVGILDDPAREAIAAELGDVLWYVARLADEMGLPLADIATGNLGKLASRAARGVIGGNGDKR